MLEIILFNSLYLYLLDMCFVGFTLNIPFIKDLRIQILLFPFFIDKVFMRFKPHHLWYGMALYDLEIPFLIDLEIRYEVG